MKLVDLKAWMRAAAASGLVAGGRVSRTEILRATTGSAVGILIAALVAPGLTPGLPGAQRVAPIGATAVLVFAVPSSPLAQPWPAIMGNTVSALIGAMCVHLFGDTGLAAPLGV